MIIPCCVPGMNWCDYLKTVTMGEILHSQLAFIKNVGHDIATFKPNQLSLLIYAKQTNLVHRNFACSYFLLESFTIFAERNLDLKHLKIESPVWDMTLSDISVTHFTFISNILCWQVVCLFYTLLTKLVSMLWKYAIPTICNQRTQNTRLDKYFCI